MVDSIKQVAMKLPYSHNNNHKIPITIVTQYCYCLSIKVKNEFYFILNFIHKLDKF